MKKLLCFILAAVQLFALFGCAAQPSVEDETTAPETTAAIETTLAATQPQVPENPDGFLFLKVSSVTMSVVGETDDIYQGTIPREEITWESDDESVVTFENGILTATGVGSTTVRASWQDQMIECTAACLAQTPEELAQLDPEILAAPKRLPPAVDLEQPCTYFEESAIIGDSITYFMFQWESKSDYLGNMTFFARGGISLNGLVKRFKNIFYRGKEDYIENIIAESGVKRVYIMLGQNDLSSKARTIVMDNWVTLLERIREKSPDVEIVLQSCIPEYAPDDSLDEKNDRIEQYNVTLREFAAENNCKFIDLGYYVRDHYDRMPQIYSQGNYHMNEAGCLNWMKILRAYAQLELEGGDLS